MIILEYKNVKVGSIEVEDAVGKGYDVNGDILLELCVEKW